MIHPLDIYHLPPPFSLSSASAQGANTGCGYPVWSMEGWKDGHLSIAPVPTGTSTLYSYDVFNSLISHLGDPVNFPNLKHITGDWMPLYPLTPPPPTSNNNPPSPHCALYHHITSHHSVRIFRWRTNHPTIFR